jgi:hypothetical protein
MKQFITLLAFTILLFANIQATSSGSNENKATKTEAQVKQEQAKQLKKQCPHYPSAQRTGAASKVVTETFDSWKKNYPQEYTAYLKIFNYTK